jgi:hypothetical protein
MICYRFDIIPKGGLRRAHFKKVPRDARVKGERKQAMTAEELRTRLLAEVEAKLKEAMSGERAPQTLSEMEVIAQKVGQAVKERIMQELVTGTPEPEGVEQCEGCGGQLRRKGKRQKWIATQAGEVQVERDYYYCEACRRGFFPPG